MPHGDNDYVGQNRSI